MGELTECDAKGIKAALFLQTIKKSTADLHVLLESNPLLLAITMPGITLHQYYCYLILMKKIAAVYEKVIPPRLTGIFSGGEQRKASQLIAEDVECIRHVPPQTFVLKDYTLPIEQMTIPFALGFMYVMEGSKLGGKVIFKHIQRSLGFSENRGAKYLADYGVNSIALWKEFLSKFSGYVAENDCEAEAIEGARYAFKSIHDFFDSNRTVYEI